MQRRDLLRFLKHAALLLLIVAVLDRLAGIALERLFYKQRHGDDATTEYVIDRSKEELLVFGSSRASHHYKTDLLAAATGFTCFNGGRDEMNITYSYAILPIIYQRYSPKVVIVEVLPTELNGADRDEMYQRISTVLLPFAHRHPELVQTIRKAGEAEVWKMRLSGIYPYNSLVGAAFQNAFTGFGHSSEGGYEPLYNVVDSQTYKKPIWGNFTKVKGTDTGLLHTMEGLIRVTEEHGTRMVVVISPLYFMHDIDRNDSYRSLVGLLSANRVTFYDFSRDPRFLLQPRLFNDDVHLNDSGATVYTRIIAEKLVQDGIVSPMRHIP